MVRLRQLVVLFIGGVLSISHVGCSGNSESQVARDELTFFAGKYLQQQANVDSFDVVWLDIDGMT